MPFWSRWSSYSVSLFLFVAPTVTYEIQLNPVAYNILQSHCISSNPQTTCATISQFYPESTTIAGHTSVEDVLFDLGPKPFANAYAVAEGNYTNSGGHGTDVFFLKGTNVTGAQYLPFPSVEVDPSGIVAIRNVSFARGPLGIVNFTATVENIGSKALSGVDISFGIPGNGDNFTYKGVNWISNPGLPQVQYGTPCPDPMAPGVECVASFEAQSETLSPGQTFGYTVRVTGALGEAGVLYNQWFQGVWPTKDATPSWVGYFIQQVNSDRTGPKLDREFFPRRLCQGPVPDAAQQLQRLQLRVPAGLRQVVSGVHAPDWGDHPVAGHRPAVRVCGLPARVRSRALVGSHEPRLLAVRLLHRIRSHDHREPAVLGDRVPGWPGHPGPPHLKRLSVPHRADRLAGHRGGHVIHSEGHMTHSRGEGIRG